MDAMKYEKNQMKKIAFSHFWIFSLTFTHKINLIMEIKAIQECVSSKQTCIKQTITTTTEKTKCEKVIKYNVPHLIIIY